MHEGYAGAVCTRVCTRGLQRKGLHEGVAQGLCSWALHEGLHDSLAHEGGVKVLHVGFARGGRTGRFCTRVLHGTQSFPPPFFHTSCTRTGPLAQLPPPCTSIVHTRPLLCTSAPLRPLPLRVCFLLAHAPPLPHSPLAQAPPCTLPLTQVAPLHTSPCTTTPLS